MCLNLRCAILLTIGESEELSAKSGLSSPVNGDRIQSWRYRAFSIC